MLHDGVKMLKRELNFWKPLQSIQIKIYSCFSELYQERFFVKPSLTT